MGSTWNDGLALEAQAQHRSLSSNALVNGPENQKQNQ